MYQSRGVDTCSTTLNLTTEQYQFLKKEAESYGVSISAVVRATIDTYRNVKRRRKAV